MSQIDVPLLVSEGTERHRENVILCPSPDNRGTKVDVPAFTDHVSINPCSLGHPMTNLRLVPAPHLHRTWGQMLQHFTKSTESFSSRVWKDLSAQISVRQPQEHSAWALVFFSWYFRKQHCCRLDTVTVTVKAALEGPSKSITLNRPVAVSTRLRLLGHRLK